MAALWRLVHQVGAAFVESLMARLEEMDITTTTNRLLSTETPF